MVVVQSCPSIVCSSPKTTKATLELRINFLHNCSMQEFVVYNLIIHIYCFVCHRFRTCFNQVNLSFIYIKILIFLKKTLSENSLDFESIVILSVFINFFFIKGISGN